MASANAQQQQSQSQQQQPAAGHGDMWGRILQRAMVCQHFNDVAGMVLGHH